MFGMPFAWSNSPTLFVRGKGNKVVTGNLFVAGQNVTISSSTKSAAIDVYDYRSNLVTSGHSPLSLTSPRAGWYMAQCASNGGDRVAFAVLPRGWQQWPNWYGVDVGATTGVPQYGVTNGLQRLNAANWYWQYHHTGDWRSEFATNRFEHSIADQLERPYKKIPGILAFSAQPPPWRSDSLATYLAGYTNYVAAMCRYYFANGFNIVAAEPANESSGLAGRYGYGLSFGEWYALLATNCAKIVHSYWPKALILMTCEAHPSWTYNTAAAARKGAFANSSPAGVVWHDYYIGVLPPDENVFDPAIDGTNIHSNYIAIANNHRAAAGLSNTAPAYVTEYQISGQSSLGTPFANNMFVPTGRPAPAEVAANRAIKFIILNRVAGTKLVAQNSWYGWGGTTSDDQHTARWFEPSTRGPQRKAAAEFAAIHKLKQAASFTYTNDYQRWVAAWRDTNANTTVVACWFTESARKTTNSLAGQDVFGNPVASVTDEPLFCTTNATPARAVEWTWRRIGGSRRSL